MILGMERLLGLVYSSTTLWMVVTTNPAWEDGFVINIALDPSHEMLDVCRSGHFSRSLVILRILPQIFKPASVRTRVPLRRVV